jgi:4-amino-4-deoxychorismate lyase
MCQLFETIRIIGGESQNLALHEERMNRSRKKLFGNNDFLKLSDYIMVPNNAKETLTRCRVIYGTSIDSVEFSPYIPSNIRTLKIVDGGTLVYDYKFLDRNRLTGLIDKNVADDILIIKNSCVTDASFANIVFTDGRQWITPDTPLLYGTMRKLLLNKGIIKESRITIDNLILFTHFRLINAMLGFDAPLLPISNIILK